MTKYWEPSWVTRRKRQAAKEQEPGLNKGGKEVYKDGIENYT